MKVWLITEPCEDTYYSQHPTQWVYDTPEKAQKKVDELNTDEDGESRGVHEMYRVLELMLTS